MLTKEHKRSAHRDVDMIFTKLFPKYGMRERTGQTELSHNMLDAMFDGSIMLSDAGTGIGKTYAYLVAAVVFHKYHIATGSPRQPVVISTASIALQDAIHREYLPTLSKMLLRAGYITWPLASVIRKGKSRYVCDRRLRIRIKKVDLETKNQRDMDALLSLRKCLDMDRVEHLSNYDRRRVAVPHICDCEQQCRYKRFLEDAASDKYIFQICNHNLLLADAMYTRLSRHPILRPYCTLIVDEAHKLPAAARQIFGRTLGQDDVFSLIQSLKNEQFHREAKYVYTAMGPVLEGIGAETETAMEAFEKNRLRLLKNGLKALELVRRMVGDDLSHIARKELVRIISTMHVFIDGSNDIILYMDRDEYQRPVLCAAAADLATQMERCLWSMQLPILLTSGTLAVDADFSRFKEEAYLENTARLVETVSLSPFKYEANCLLYVPYRAPYQGKGDSQKQYYRALARSIEKLLLASCGHALVLFNSYDAMAAVHSLLKEFGLPYAIFAMARNDPTVTARFKQSGNGVLLATGAAWEGMDFPGDIVSMLIIPRLPFPIPDAFSDHLREQYASLKEFIHAVAIPDMQIKLRQGFGRAIRLETDTCVVAVLDERATIGSRYHNAMKAALPDMPMAGLIENVRDFLQQKKAPAYFSRK